MILKRPGVPPRATKAPDDQSITFPVQKVPDPFQATLRVVARDGLRGLKIEAIAAETGRVVGTVGRHRIDSYVAFVVESCFEPLIALFERQRLPRRLDRPTIESLIYQMLELDTLASPHVMQARALAATLAARRSEAEGEPSMLALFRAARSDTKQIIATRVQGRVVDVTVDFAEQAISYYLSACARHTGTE